MDAAAAPLAPSPARSLAGREHRACLAHFYAGPALSAEQKLRACLEGVADRARRLSDLDAQEVRDRQRNKERTWQKHIERWEAAVHAVYLEEEGLLSGAGYRRAEQFLGASFPGDPASRTYLSEYVGMARYLSESMALTMGTSIGFLIDLSQVRYPDVIAWLWGQAQTGRPPRFVRQGVLSAITARGGGASPAEIQKAAEEGVERAETAARLLRGQGRAAAKREASKTKLLAALGGALLHLGDEVRPAAEALLRLLGRPEAPEAAEAAPAERRERPRSEPEDAFAAERVKPVATLPAPAEPAAERAERAEGEKEEAGEKEEPHHAPAPRPPRRAPYQEILPVSYPHYEADYSQAERHACAALTAFAYLQLRGDRLLHMFCKEKVAVRAELQHHYCVATNRYADIRREVEERIAAWAEAGRLVQEEVQKDHPDVPAEDLWPLEVRPERARPERAMTWIFADVFDPLPKDDPSDAELELFWVLGLLEAAADHLECFLGRLDVHDEVSETLMHQLERQMYRARGPIGRLIVHFRPAMQVVEEQLLLQKPEREAARARATLADAAVVVLADDRVPDNLVKVATAKDGTHVALTLERAWVTVALGATGVGKSQLGVQLCEGLIMHLPGINRLTRRRVSNQAYSRAAQLYSFRPTCIEAGGESVTRGR